MHENQPQVGNGHTKSITYAFLPNVHCHLHLNLTSDQEEEEKKNAFVRLHWKEMVFFLEGRQESAYSFW